VAGVGFGSGMVGTGRLCLLESPSGRRSIDSDSSLNAVPPNRFRPSAHTDVGAHVVLARVEGKRGEGVVNGSSSDASTFTAGPTAGIVDGRSWSSVLADTDARRAAARLAFRPRAVRTDGGARRPREFPRFGHRRPA
jgi:hypothetical protein